MPKKVKVPRIVLKFADELDSEDNVRRAYNVIFDLARKEISRKEKKDEEERKVKE